MNYTESADNVVDAGTGFRRHEDNAAVTTIVSEKDMNMLIWSLMDVVKAAGHVGIQFDETNPATYKLLTKALRAMFGVNVTTLNLANSPLVLTNDHAGLVLVDATAGNVSATLPAANILTTPVSLRFFRVDATTNTATVNRAGADTFVGGATSFTLAGQGDRREIESDAVSKWALAGTSAASSAEAQAYASATKFIAPASLAAALQGSNQSLVAAGGYQKLPGGLILQWGFGTASAAGSAVVFPIAFPTATLVAIAGTASSSSYAACISITTTGFMFYSSGSTSNHFWFALGK